MVYDKRIAGGKVFLEGSGLVMADLLIADGAVAGVISPADDAEAAETVDAQGCWVLPGAIDPHVHLGKDIRIPRDADDAALETASAAAGGVTSMLVYLMSSNSYTDEVDIADGAMRGNSYVNYGYHFVLGTDQHLKEIPDYIAGGVSSFKFFMNFRDDEGSYLGLPGNDDSFMYRLLELAAANGAMVNPHPENIELVRMIRAQERDESLNPLEAWNAARPPFVEAEAAQRVAYLAKATGASVYCVHTSSGEAVEAIRRQQASYPNIFIETCTQYLTLDTDADAGVFAKVNPPVRPRADVEALWEAFKNGGIDTVGSDHNARHKSNKEEKDIWSASAGFPGTGGMLLLTLSEALARNIPLGDVVNAISTNSAKLFGMYPRKGTIRVGADADLVVIDPHGQTHIEADSQYSAADYTPWEGVSVPLAVRHTIVGGESVFSNGTLTGCKPGTFIHRAASGEKALRG